MRSVSRSGSAEGGEAGATDDAVAEDAVELEVEVAGELVVAVDAEEE